MSIGLNKYRLLEESRWIKKGNILIQNLNSKNDKFPGRETLVFSTKVDRQLVELLMFVSNQVQRDLAGIFMVIDSHTELLPVEITFPQITDCHERRHLLPINLKHSEFSLCELVLYYRFLLENALRKTIHDIKSPLNSIMLSIELLEENKYKNDTIPYKTQSLLKKFSHYCEWMPKQFEHLLAAQMLPLQKNQTCSISTYVSQLSRHSQDNNILFDVSATFEHTNYYFTTNKGLNWWLSEFIQTIKLLFNPIKAKATFNSPPGEAHSRLHAVFTSYISESWNDHLYRVFQRDESGSTRLQAILQQLRFLGFEFELNFQSNKTINFTLITPTFDRLI